MRFMVIDNPGDLDIRWGQGRFFLLKGRSLISRQYNSPFGLTSLYQVWEVSAKGLFHLLP